MMSLRRQLSIVIPLSVAAAGAGILLARGDRTVPSAPEARERDASIPVRRASSPSSSAPARGREKEVRDAVSSASTAVLWEWLDTRGREIQGDKDESLIHEVLEELYAREGIGVWTALLGHQDKGGREKFTNLFLGMLSGSDPWLAYDLFLESKDSFGARWGRGANANILMAACAISVDKYIEVMERSGYKETYCWFNVELPAGFDYARLIAHLGSSEHMPSGLPSNLIARWTQQSPAEAAEWLLSQPKPDAQSGLRYLLDEEFDYRRTLLDMLFSLAETTAVGRDEGLAAFSRLPPEAFEKSWDLLADKLGGKVNASVLDAATRMGVREDYLVLSLLEARGQAAPDASWSSIPAEDRWRAVDLAERRWREEEPSPVNEKARQVWRARLQEAWDGGK